MSQDIRRYLPSKHFTRILVSALIVCGFIVALAFLFRPKTLANQDLALINSRETLVNQDSDNDGVFDWEEVLWRLDPQNPDSDGDGVLDGQEVALARENLSASQPVDSENKKSISQTEALGQQFYLFASANPNATQAEVQSFANDVIESLMVDSIVDYVDESDFKVGPNNPPAYYLAMFEAFEPINNPNKPNDLLVLESFVTGEVNASTEQDLQTLITSYKTSAQKLQTIKPPLDIFEDHVAITNAILNIATSIEIVQSSFEADPIISISSIGLYNLSADIFLSHMENLELYFVTNDIL